MGLQQILDDAAEHFPAKTAVFFFGGRLNYGTLRAQANRFASALMGIGLGRENVWACYCPICRKRSSALSEP
jgi:non-ribosomal peptide synthetase component F